VLLNKIWALQSLIGNHFYPQQKLVSKVRDGAKIAKKYDTAQTPHARAVIAHSEVKALPKRRLAKEHERSQRRREPAPNIRRGPPWPTRPHTMYRSVGGTTTGAPRQVDRHPASASARDPATERSKRR